MLLVIKIVYIFFTRNTTFNLIFGHYKLTSQQCSSEIHSTNSENDKKKILDKKLIHLCALNITSNLSLVVRN